VWWTQGSAVSFPSGVWDEAPDEKLFDFDAYLSLKSCSGAIVSKYLIVKFLVMTKFGHAFHSADFASLLLTTNDNVGLWN